MAPHGVSKSGMSVFVWCFSDIEVSSGSCWRMFLFVCLISWHHIQ